MEIVKAFKNGIIRPETTGLLYYFITPRKTAKHNKHLNIC